MQEKYDISGMSCASCAIHVHDAVAAVKGINSCDVNLLMNSMTVEKDENVSSDSIIEAVKNAGYDASLSGSIIKNNDDEIKKKRNRLIASLLFMLPLSYISMAHMFNLPIPELLSNETPLVFAVVQFVLSTIIYCINYKRILTGLKQLLKGTPTMDSLIAVSCFASVVYGLYITVKITNSDYSKAVELTHSLYFETGAMVLTFSSIGKFLEELSKVKTTDSITSLIKITPSTAIKIEDGKQIRVKAVEVKKGDILLIKPGAKIPVDGTVIEGHSYNDQSSITGESIPVEKTVDDKLISGCLNLNGSLKMKAESDYKDSTFAKIIDLVSQASVSKAPISLLADKISSVFVPAVLIISAATFIIWYFICKDFYRSFTYAMSVLVVSCPCALGLATPTAIMVAAGKGAKMSILYKNAAVIEETSRINTIGFDKTNTITHGKPQVIKEEIVNSIDEMYDIIYALENNSEHPLASAVINYISDKTNESILTDNQYIVGQGMKCHFNGNDYAIGNAKLMNSLNVKNITEFNDGSSTVLYFSKNEQLISVYYILDTLKDGVKETLDKLKDYNLLLITGDNKNAAEAIADASGIKNVYHDVLPQQKQQIIIDHQHNGEKVAMIGDGINDSVALTTADIGISVNNATDIAIESSDIVIMNDDISAIYNTFAFSKFTMKIMKENLLWALGYNALLIPIASGLLSKLGLSLNPMLSSLIMSLSSVTVVTNALRINTFKPFKASVSNVSNKTVYVLDIDHMMCEHCQKNVENALLDCGYISTTELKGSIATIITDKPFDEISVKQTLEKAGYHLTSYTTK